MSYDALGRLITEVQQNSGGPPVLTVVDRYDAGGNMTLEWRGAVRTTYTYDRENRVSVKNFSGDRTTMTYNGDGQRITRKTSSQLTTFIWDGSDYSRAVGSSTG